MMVSSQVLPVLALVLTLVVHVASQNCDGGNVNGCSTWDITPYKKTFTPACNRHDVCYACGKDFGKSRKWCDDEFKSNMKDLCKWYHIGCKPMADIYYATVRLVGSLRYRNPSRGWCDESWVPDCL